MRSGGRNDVSLPLRWIHDSHLMERDRLHKVERKSDKEENLNISLKKSEEFCGNRLHFKKDCAMIWLVTGGTIKQRGRAI